MKIIASTQHTAPEKDSLEIEELIRETMTLERDLEGAPSHGGKYSRKVGVFLVKKRVIELGSNPSAWFHTLSVEFSGVDVWSLTSGGGGWIHRGPWEPDVLSELRAVVADLKSRISLRDSEEIARRGAEREARDLEKESQRLRLLAEYQTMIDQRAASDLGK